MSEAGIKKPPRAASCTNKERKRRLTHRAAADPPSQTNASGHKTGTARSPVVKTSSEPSPKIRTKSKDKASSEFLSKSQSSPGHLVKATRLSGRPLRRRAQLPSSACSKQQRDGPVNDKAAASSEEESSSESEDSSEDDKKTTVAMTKKKLEAAHSQKKTLKQHYRRCAFDTLFKFSSKVKVRRVFPKLPTRSDRLLEAETLPSNTNYHSWFRDGSGDILPCLPQVSSDKAFPEPWRTCPLILGDVADNSITCEKLLTCAPSKLKMKKKGGSDAIASKRTLSTSWPLSNMRPTVYETNSHRLLQDFAASSDDLLFASAVFPLENSRSYYSYDLLFPSQILAYRSQHKATNQNNDNNSPRRRDKTAAETFIVDPRLSKTPLAIRMLNSIRRGDSRKHINYFNADTAFTSCSEAGIRQDTSSRSPNTEETNLSNENASADGLTSLRTDLSPIERSSYKSQITSLTKKWSIICEPVPGENTFRLKLTSPEEQRDKIMSKMDADASSKAAVNGDSSSTEHPCNKAELHPALGPELGAKIDGTTELNYAGSSTDVKNVKSTTSCTKIDNYGKIQIPITNWRYAEKLFRRFPVRKVNSVVRKSLSEVIRDLREEKGCLINNCKTCGGKGKAFVKKNRVEAPASAKNPVSTVQSAHIPNKLTPQQILASTVKASSPQQPKLPMSFFFDGCSSLPQKDSEDFQFEVDSFLACAYSNVPDSNVNFNVSSYNTQKSASDNSLEKTETSNYLCYHCCCAVCMKSFFISNTENHDIKGSKSSSINQPPKLKMLALEKAVKSYCIDWHINDDAENLGRGLNESTVLFDSNCFSKIINNRSNEKAFNALVESFSYQCMLLESLETKYDTTFLLNSRSPLLITQQMLLDDNHAVHKKMQQNCILMENTLNERKNRAKDLLDCTCCIFTAIESLIYKSKKYPESSSNLLLRDAKVKIPLYKTCRHRCSLKGGAEYEDMAYYCSQITDENVLLIGGSLTKDLPMCKLKSKKPKPDYELVKGKLTKLIESDTEASLAKSSKHGASKLIRSETFCYASPFFHLTMFDPSEQRLNVHKDSSIQYDISEEISDKHILLKKATSNFEKTHRSRGHRLKSSLAQTDCSHSNAGEDLKKFKVRTKTLPDIPYLLVPSHDIYHSQDEYPHLPPVFAHKTQETEFKTYQNEVEIKTNKIILKSNNKDECSCLKSYCVKFDNSLERTNMGIYYQLTVSDCSHFPTAVISCPSPLLEPSTIISEKPVLNVSNSSSFSTDQDCKAKQEMSTNRGCSIPAVAVLTANNIKEYVENCHSFNTFSESHECLCSLQIKSPTHRHNVGKNEEPHSNCAYNDVGGCTLKGDVSTQSHIRKSLSNTSNEHCQASLSKTLYLNSNSEVVSDSVLIENVEKDNTDKISINILEYSTNPDSVEPSTTDKPPYTSRNKTGVLPADIPVVPPNSPEPVKCKPVITGKRQTYQERMEHITQLSRPRMPSKRFRAGSDAVVQKNATTFVSLPLKTLNVHKNYPGMSAVSLFPPQTLDSAASTIMTRRSALQGNRLQSLNTLCCMGLSVGNNPADIRKLECKHFSSYTREPILLFKEQKIPGHVTHAQLSETLLGKVVVDLNTRKPHISSPINSETVGRAAFCPKHVNSNKVTTPKPMSNLGKDFAFEKCQEYPSSDRNTAVTFLGKEAAVIRTLTKETTEPLLEENKPNLNAIIAVKKHADTAQIAKAPPRINIDATKSPQIFQSIYKSSREREKGVFFSDSMSGDVKKLFPHHEWPSTAKPSRNKCRKLGIPLGNNNNNIGDDQINKSMDSALNSIPLSLYDLACFTEHQNSKNKEESRSCKKSAFLPSKITGTENGHQIQMNKQSPLDKESSRNKPVLKQFRKSSSRSQNKFYSLDSLCAVVYQQCQDSQETPGTCRKRDLSVLRNITEQTSNSNCKDSNKHVKHARVCYVLSTDTFRQKEHKDNTNCEILNISNKPKPKENRKSLCSDPVQNGLEQGQKVISSLPVARLFKPLPKIFWASAHAPMENPSKAKGKILSSKQRVTPKLMQADVHFATGIGLS